MKTKVSLFLTLSMLMFSCSSTVIKEPPASKEVSLEAERFLVIDTQGTPMAVSRGKSSQLRIGDFVYPGTNIRTGPDDTVALVASSNMGIFVGQGTALEMLDVSPSRVKAKEASRGEGELETAMAASFLRIQMTEGIVLGCARHRSDESGLVVNIPYSSLRLSSCVFKVTIQSPDILPQVSVFDGEASLAINRKAKTPLLLRSNSKAILAKSGTNVWISEILTHDETEIAIASDMLKIMPASCLGCY